MASDVPQPRPYQERAHAAITAAFAGGAPAALAVMPTGSGKTIVFARVAREGCDRGHRTLVLAHRGELLDQARRHLAAQGLAVAVEVAGQRANPSGFNEAVVASIQTMQGNRLARWPPGYFDLVIVDEAHHVLAPTYVKALAHLKPRRLLGVTATPDRGDGGKLSRVFGAPAFEYPLKDAIEEQYLAKIIIERPTTQVDLSKINTTRGDFNKGDLEDAIRPHVEELVNATRARIGDRPTLVFTPDVGSAQAFADGLRQVGVTARSVSGDSVDRHETLAAFGSGDFQALANCSLVSEGVDVPRIAAVVLARPTQSGVLYRQMIGRGTRLYPGKENLLVIDFAWNSASHRLVTPIELFDTSGMDQGVQDLANGLLRTYPRIDPLKAIAQAERIHRHAATLAVRCQAKETTYRFVAFDPLAIGTLLNVPHRRDAANARPVNARQLDRLGRLKLGAEGLTERSAERLLGVIDERRRAGLATHRQVALLVARGLSPEEANAVRFDEVDERLGLAKIG